MKKLTKKDVFRILDSNMCSSDLAQQVKDYIDRIHPETINNRKKGK